MAGVCALFLYSALGLDQETTGSSTTAYTRDNGGTLVSERTPSGTYYYLFDGLGSTAALTDSSGNVVNTYQYDPYGNVTTSSGSVANPYRFGGGYGAYTDSSGLLKIGQRYDDPTRGRWQQQDPLAIGGNLPIWGSLPRNVSAGCPMNPTSWHRYTSVSDNPIDFADASGLMSCQTKAEITCDVDQTAGCGLLCTPTSVTGTTLACGIACYLLTRKLNKDCQSYLENRLCGKQP